MDASPVHLIHYKDNKWPTDRLTVSQLSTDVSDNTLAKASMGLGALPLPVSN